MLKTLFSIETTKLTHYHKNKNLFFIITHTSIMESASKPSISYVLFLYREQLRKGNLHSLQLNHTKISLTEKLIRKTEENIRRCSLDDMMTLNRQIMFRNKLKHQIILHQLSIWSDQGQRKFSLDTPQFGNCKKAYSQ